MDVWVRLSRRLSTEELMLLNFDAGEDLWEPLGQQGDQISQSWRKSTLDIHWKDWCWSANTLTTWCEEPTHWKRLWCWERLRAWAGNDRGWDGWMAPLLNGHGFEQTPGDSEGQGGLACCSPGLQSQTWLSDWATRETEERVLSDGFSVEEDSLQVSGCRRPAGFSVRPGLLHVLCRKRGKGRSIENTLF